MRRILPILLGALVLAAPATAGDRREAHGSIAAVSPESVSVRSDHGTLSCRLGEHSPSLAGYSAGDRVAVVCARVSAAWRLMRIRHLPAVPAASTSAPQSLGGAVTGISATSLTVRDGDRSLTCSLGEHSPAVAGLSVGDRVRIACVDGVLAKLQRVTAPVLGSGTVVAVSGQAISIHGDHDLTCSVGPQSPSVGTVHVGDRVKVACAGGVLVALARLDAPAPPPPAPATDTTLWAAGAIVALTPGSISVHGEHDVTCTLTDGSPRLGDFRAGDHVRIGCTHGVLVAIARL